MIYQLKNAEDKLFKKLKPSHYSRRIKSHYLAYGVKYDFSRLFIVERDSEPVGIISVFNASMLITELEDIVFTENELEDIAIFIKMTKPYSVEIPSYYDDAIEPMLSDMYSPDDRTEFAFCSKGEIPDLEVDECPSLDDVFSILRESFPTLAQAYELWITDTSHRVRHGLSQSFLMGDYTTATIQYIIDKKALIGHVATRPEHRGKFFARKLLYWIGERLTNDGFDVRLFARPHRVSYYEEIGFKAIGHDKVFEIKPEYRH